MTPSLNRTGHAQRSVPPRMTWSEEQIEALRRVPLERLAAVEGWGLQPAAGAHKTLCPFHGERTASFFLYADGHAHCYGCDAHFGDLIALVQRLHQMGFREACSWISDTLGAGDMPAGSISAPRVLPLRQPVSAETRAVLDAATAHYQFELSQRPEQLAYLRERGLSDRVIACMRLGYASGNQLGRGIWEVTRGNLGLLMNVGLLHEPDADRPSRGLAERLAGRITFPVLDARTGEVIYMIGRATRDDQKAKYLGLVDGAAHKLPMVAGPIVEPRAQQNVVEQAIVVEGPIDFAALLEWELDRTHLCVASLGTALSQTLAVLSQFGVREVTHLTDQDAAGSRAGLALAGELAARGVGCQVVVDTDRSDELRRVVTQLPAGRRAELAELRTSPPTEPDRAEWRAVQELGDLDQLAAMGWRRAVRWQKAAKDAGDLLRFKQRGYEMLLQAVV